MSLTDFKATYRQQILDLLWRQWTSLGVSGHSADWQGAVIDPEALLLASCTMARYDARLFDAMLEWLAINGKYINVQRLKRILSTEPFSGARVLKAVAATIATSVSVAKWASLVERSKDRGDEPLFFLGDGKPMPVVAQHDPIFAEHGLFRDRFKSRSVAARFNAEASPNLILRLRAFMGVNARCEILAFLLLNHRGSPRAIAHDTYYFPATIAKTLGEMRDSGFLVSRVEGRHHYHSVVPDTWKKLFLVKNKAGWIVWPRLLGALETLWIFLEKEDLDCKSALAQASALRRVLMPVIDNFEKSLPDFTFGDPSSRHGEALLPFFMERVTELLRQVM
ncbi:MAG: hypothetical protein V1754_12430 [Pseudomonadota bacterium]